MRFHQNKKSIEFKVGLFSIIAIVILIACYSWFTEIMESRKYTPLKVKFKNAGNIEIGSTITVHGVKKGRVKELKIEDDGVVVFLQVELDFPLKEGTKFFILESNLMGDVLLEIIPGGEEQVLDLELIQTGEKNYGLTKLVAELSEVVYGIESILSRITNKEGFLENLQSIVDTSNVIINKINKSIDSNSAEIDKLISNASEISERLSRIIKNNEENINQTFALSSEVITKLNKTLNKMEDVTQNFQEISDKMLQEDSSFNRLITEKDLYENLLKATVSLDSLLKDIKENPKRYFKIKVF